MAVRREPSSAFLADSERQLSAQIRVVAFKASELISWDTSVIVFVVQLSGTMLPPRNSYGPWRFAARGAPALGFGRGSTRKKGARKEAAKATFLEHVGHTAIGAGDSLGEMLKFLGEMTVTFFRLLRMKVRFRAVDLFLLIQQCGAQALPIVTLISFLVGVILAFVGAVQLKQFGAQIYVADLVGIAIVHEMGAMMTGIIMAGRTGRLSPLSSAR